MSYIWAQQRDLDVLLKYESCPPLYEVTAFYNLTILVKDAISFAFACRPGMSSRSSCMRRCGTSYLLFGIGFEPPWSTSLANWTVPLGSPSASSSE